MEQRLVPPDSIAGLTPDEVAAFKTEYDVLATLRSMGHEVMALGVGDDLRVIREAVESWRPDVCFNLLEEFAGQATYDQNVVSYLELLGLPCTGCGPRGLMLARDKALSKQVLACNGVQVPEFAVFPRGRNIRRPSGLEFPLIVKSLSEEASLGISQASLVDTDERLRERVAFIHERIGTDAIAEQYIAGRELYVGILGHRRPQVLPVWELVFGHLPDDEPRIATARAKWNLKYQEKWGIRSEAAVLPPEMHRYIARVARRIQSCLDLSGYARIDMRLTPEGELYVLEANPNPQIARAEDFADSAQAAGISYPRLLQRIVNIAFSRARQLVA